MVWISAGASAPTNGSTTCARRPRERAVIARALVAVSAGVILLSPAPVRVVGAQQAAFSSKIESVRVDVLVLDNGRPILGLGPADFEIVDNGVPQQVDLVSFENIPLNVVLALDMSDSVAGDRLEQLQDAGRAVLGGLTKGDQAAVVTFSNAVTRAAALTEDIAVARLAVEQAWGRDRPRSSTASTRR